jgi:hypothetical protein
MTSGMDFYQRQQFDFLLQTATERFVARLEERHRGPEAAAAALRSDPIATKGAIDEFVAAVFADFLLDNADGAAFVLRSLPQRPIAAHRDAIVATVTVEESLTALARGLFGELLLVKTVEALDQHARYQAVGPVAP